jgi:hypothetical protein
MDRKTKIKTVRFFKALFRECDEGSIRIQFIPSNKKKYIGLKRIEKIPGILKANKSKEEGYSAISTRKEVKGKQDITVQIPALWVKFTGRYPEDVLMRLKNKGLTPSIIVNSPECVFFWILRKPVGKKEVKEVENILKKLATELGGDMVSGSAKYYRQVCRIPKFYQLNKKDDVLLRYDLNDLEKLWEPTEPSGLEPEEGEEEKVVKYDSITLRDIYDYSNPAYLIKTILEKNTFSILGAYAGVGKSIIALSIIKSILTAKPLWGRFEVVKRGPVLLVDEETPRPWLKRRIKMMKFQESLPLTGLHFQGVRVDEDASFDALMAKIEETRPVLVVFDSLIRFHDKNELNASDMSSVMERFRKIVNWGTTVIVLHHHKKGGAKKEEKLRGSTDILAGIDVEFSLTRKGKNQLIFESVKSRTEPIPIIKLRTIFSQRQIEVVCEGVVLSNNEKILFKVKEILKKGEVGVKEVKEALKKKGFKVADQRLRDILKEAVETKILFGRKVGKKKIVYGLNLTANS